MRKFMKNSGETIELNLGGGSKIDAFAGRPLASLHEFYLSGEVKRPDEYTAWFDIIRNCGPSDIVKLHINSPGGDLFTAIQFLRVLGECPGTVITSVEGSCMSAATMIFLCADQFEISPHSVFMFHNYSTGMYGKGGELYDTIVHERKWSENLLNEIYEDILTEEEIESILNNKDIWMSGDEVKERVEAKVKKLNDAMSEEQDDEADEEIIAMFEESVSHEDQMELFEEYVKNTTES